MLVRFQDINDPRTIEKVDPDNLAASFGPGFRLRRITVQVTDAPTTIGILNRFPWWKKYTNRWFNGDKCCSVNRLSKDISSRVSVHSFSTEWKDNFYE